MVESKVSEAGRAFDSTPFFVSRLSTPHNKPHTHMGSKKRAKPDRHRHGLADDMESPWNNGVRVRVKRAGGSAGGPPRVLSSPIPSR